MISSEMLTDAMKAYEKIHDIKTHANAMMAALTAALAVRGGGREPDASDYKPVPPKNIRPLTAVSDAYTLAQKQSDLLRSVVAPPLSATEVGGVGEPRVKSHHEDTVTDARKLAHEINSDVMAGEKEIAEAIEAGFRFREADAYAKGAVEMREAAIRVCDDVMHGRADVPIDTPGCAEEICIFLIRALELPKEQ